MDDKPFEFDVNDFVDEPTATEESSTPETKEVQVQSEDAPETSEEPKVESDSDVQADAEEPEADEPKKGAEARKEQLSREIRELNARKNELQATVERLTVQPTPSVDEMIEQGIDPAIAQIQALKQEMANEKTVARLTELNTSIETEAVRVMSDIPMFDPQSGDYNESVATQVAALYEQSAGIQRDPQTGLIVQANVLPYNFYKAFADIYQESTKTAEVRGQKANAKMLASAEVPSSAAPKKTSDEDDPFLKGFGSA